MIVLGPPSGGNVTRYRLGLCAVGRFTAVLARAPDLSGAPRRPLFSCGGHPAGRYGHSHAGCSNSPDQGGPDLVPLSSGLSLLGSKDRDRPPGSPRSSLSIIGLPASTDPYYQPSTRPSKTVPISRYPLCCCIYSLCGPCGFCQQIRALSPKIFKGSLPRS